jgi:drug/metabolite transporter (DMT)-like permease
LRAIRFYGLTEKMVLVILLALAYATVVLVGWAERGDVRVAAAAAGHLESPTAAALWSGASSGAAGAGGAAGTGDAASLAWVKAYRADRAGQPELAREALAAQDDAVLDHVRSALAQGDPVPTPSPVTLRAAAAGTWYAFVGAAFWQPQLLLDDHLVLLGLPAWSWPAQLLVFWLVALWHLAWLLLPRPRYAADAPRPLLYELLALLVPGSGQADELYGVLLLVPWALFGIDVADAAARRRQPAGHPDRRRPGRARRPVRGEPARLGGRVRVGAQASRPPAGHAARARALLRPQARAGGRGPGARPGVRPPPATATGYLSVFAAALLWSLIGRFSRTVLDAGVGPLEIAFWRALIAGAAFALHALLTRQARLRPWPAGGADLAALAAFALIGVTLFYAALALAIDAGGISLAFVLLYTAPAFVALLAWPLLGEPLSRRKLLLVGLAMVGVALVARAGAAAASRQRGRHRLGAGVGRELRQLLPVRQVGAARYAPVTIFAWVLPLGALGLLPLVRFAPKPPEAWGWLSC